MLVISKSLADPEDLVSLQEQHAAEINILNNELESLQSNINTLQDEIIYLQDNSGAFLTGPNVAFSNFCRNRYEWYKW